MRLFLIIFMKIKQFFVDFQSNVRYLGFNKLNPYVNSFFSWDYSAQSAIFRIWLVMLFIGFGYSLLIFRLIDISLSDEDSLYKRSFVGYHKFIRDRREIVDRNNTLLAVNLSTASLYANPKKMIDPVEATSLLTKVIPGIDQNSLLRDLKSDKNFVWVKRDLTPKEQYGVHNLGIPGFYFQQDQRRVYTYSNLMSHILGYVGRDGHGLAGIESYFDKKLLNVDIQSSPSQNPLELAIDIRVQNIVSEELEYTIKKFSAKGGVGIIADANNGEIIAMVSKPDFDPHNPAKASADELFNKATLGVYEVGSVFKAITIAIGFDSKKLQINDLYNLSAPIKISKYSFKDFHPRPGWRTVAEIFMYSSNIGVVQIVLELGKEIFKKYLKNLGFMNQVDIELPERGTPLLPPNKLWGDINTATMSYGNGLSVSPLHMVQAMIPVVNGGYMHKLSLIKKNGYNKSESIKVLDEGTSFLINKLLRLTVTKGTGKMAEVKGYIPGGKTGTANKPQGGKYSKNSRLSSFLGAFPMVNPKYVFYIMIDDPKGIKETYGYATAGYTAAPTAGNIISRIGTLYGIDPIDDNDPEINNILHVDYSLDEAI